MSRFSEKERKEIEEKILKEGEALFAQKGLKNVKVDDITEKVGIGKGTFYHFYENKEHLYLELYIKAQEKIFLNVDEIIENAKGKEKKELCINIMISVLHEFLSSPIIGKTDSATWSQAAKKVSKDYYKENNEADSVILLKIQRAGITFRYPQEVVMRLMQSTCLAAMALHKTDPDMSITRILLEGVVNQILREEENE